MSSTAAPPTPLATLRVVVLAMMAAPVVILVGLFAALPDRTATPDPLWPGLALVLVVGAAVLVPALGYRVPALEPATPSEEAQSRSLAALQTTTFLRFALSEAPLIASIGLAFVSGRGGLWVYLIGLVGGEALLLWHAYPSERVLERVRRQLERAGGQASFG